MKKVTRILGLCALVALATVSCKKDDNNAPQGGKSFRATINQPTDGAKTHIGDGNYLMWNSGDEIKVYTADGTSAVFTTTDADVYEDAVFTGDIKEADKYVAFYPADNASDAQEGNVILTLPDQQTYEANNFANDAYPMAACWEGTAGDDVDFQFHSPCAVVCLPLKGNANVTSIDLSGKALTDVLAGTLKVDINNFDPANPSAGGYTPVSAKWTVSLSCGNGVQLDPDIATNFYFVVAAPHEIFKSGLKFVVNYEGGSETLETTKDNRLSAETILTMPEKEINYPVIEGRFLVSAAGEPQVFVEFAPGNVWYEGSTGTWHFEDSQFGYHTFPSYDGSQNWGLFAFSTNECHEFNGEEFHYGVSSIDADASGSGPGGADPWDSEYWPFYLGMTFEDWADNFNDGQGWYTLSQTEWQNILDNHVKRYCNVNGQQGLVIMPYGWVGTLNYNIDSNEWAELEADHAAFLPGIGVRFAKVYGPEVTFYNYPSVSYWSSTILDEESPHNNPRGYNMAAIYDGQTQDYSVNPGTRSHGMCVRLAKPYDAK